MAMAERQSEHREKLESLVVNGNVASQTRGSYFAFILALSRDPGRILFRIKG